MKNLRFGQKRVRMRQKRTDIGFDVCAAEKDRAASAGPEEIPGIVEQLGRDEHKVPRIQIEYAVLHEKPAGAFFNMEQFIIGMAVVGRHDKAGFPDEAFGINSVDGVGSAAGRSGLHKRISCQGAAERKRKGFLIFLLYMSGKASVRPILR